MPNLANKKDCTGCTACINVCAHKAIVMYADSEGFLYPTINESQCVQCGLCEQVCPVLTITESGNTDQPIVYAMWHKHDRVKSSSGGAFSALARLIFSKGGKVYGAAFGENLVLQHVGISSIEELQKLRGSKYLQSNLGDIFKDVKKDLLEERWVLFCGTPCQIAGLKGFLRKDYENLFTIDLICNGVQSRLLFEKYKQNFMLDKDDDEFITNINFRSKIEGWGKYCTEIKTNKHSYKIQNDLYPKVMDFSANYCCGECKFNKIPRAGDVTIGDFWGVENFNPNLNDKKGLSIILVNSTKGKKILKQIEDICVLTSVPLEVAINGNPNITGRIKSKGKQEVFLSKIQNPNISYIRLMKKYTKLPFYVIVYKILPNFIKSFIKKKILKKN